MKEHPILFSTPMVQAILRDVNPKTQTRRVIKDIQKWHPLPEITCLKFKGVNCGSILSADGEGFAQKYLKTICPYGQVGGKLWVRESFCQVCYKKDLVKDVCYKEDLTHGFKPCEKGCKFTPSIHMPRWASRITLEITDIRVQRVQEITENDAQAEGIEFIGNNGKYHYSYLDSKLNAYMNFETGKEAFKDLWDTINSKPRPSLEKDENGKLRVVCYYSYPWEEGNYTKTYRGKPWYVIGNPWCWAITFKKLPLLTTPDKR